MIRNHVSTSLRGSIHAILAGCGMLIGVASIATAADLIYYSAQTSSQYISSRAAVVFAKKVEEATGGDVKLRVRFAGSLSIQANSVTQAVSDNVVQIGEDTSFSGNVPIAGIVKLPGLAATYEEYDKAEKAVRPVIEKGYAQRNAVVLYTFAVPQYLWANVPLKSLADLKGLKVRASSPEQGEFVRQNGGSSVTIGPAEVPSALERGVVDAIITGIGGGELWQDQLKTAYLYPVNFNGAYIVINKTAYDALKPDQQAKLKKAAEEASRWLRDTSIEEDEASLNKMRAKMAIANPTPADLASGAKTMPAFWNDWAQKQGPDGVSLLQAVQAAVAAK